MTTVEEISELTRPQHPGDWTELDSAAVDTVRVLAADAVQKVGNGHPGTAMSLAPLAYTLFQRQMRHDPSDTHWIGRDWEHNWYGAGRFKQQRHRRSAMG